MLTPQEVSARSFTNTMMGGYNMTMVDEFLDELTDDYTSLYKENASLKAKMKVLVEKVEEYRATEDSMRATLLTAQRMADSIVKEAEKKRDDILQRAEGAAREKLEDLRKEADGYNKRIRQGQDEIQRFIAESRALCEKELKFLDEFPNSSAEADSEETLAVKEIEKRVLAAEQAAVEAVSQAAPQPEAVQTVPAPTPQPAVETPSAETLLDALTAKEAASDPVEDLNATRRVNINDLKFGPNYRSETD